MSNNLPGLSSQVQVFPTGHLRFIHNKWTTEEICKCSVSCVRCVLKLWQHIRSNTWCLRRSKQTELEFVYSFIKHKTAGGSEALGRNSTPSKIEVVLQTESAARPGSARSHTRCGSSGSWQGVLLGVWSCTAGLQERALSKGVSGCSSQWSLEGSWKWGRSFIFSWAADGESKGSKRFGGGAGGVVQESSSSPPFTLHYHNKVFGLCLHLL